MTGCAGPPAAGTRRMRPVVRSETRASPPGRNAIPHGTCRPRATTRTAGCAAGGPAVELADPDPSEPPQDATRAETRSAAIIGRRNAGKSFRAFPQDARESQIEQIWRVAQQGGASAPPRAGAGAGGAP